MPDIHITPRVVDLTVVEGKSTCTASFSLVDYREKPLAIKGIRVSSPNLKVRLVEGPKAYLPGWRYVFEVFYSGGGGKMGSERSESVTVATSDPAYGQINVGVAVRFLTRIRVFPDTIILSPGGDPASVLVRDSSGEAVQIESVDVPGGLVIANFDGASRPVQKITLALAAGAPGRTKFPVTVRIKVKQPCAASVSITVTLGGSGRSPQSP